MKPKSEWVTTFSQDRVYRYTLWRDFGPTEEYAQFIGLNPSTADETLDDPTIRRCVAFAKSWGCSGLCMTNLFAYRATDPNVMKGHSSPIGILNQSSVLSAASGAKMVVAAWGNHGKHLFQGVKMKIALREAGVSLYHLGLNADGSPKHPLYLKSSTKPTLWE